MAFQAVPQTVLVTILGQQDKQLTVNDLYFQNSAVPNPTNMAAIALGVQNFVGTSLAPLLSRDWSSTLVRVVDLSTDPGLVLEVGEEDTGGVDVEAAPNNVAACVSFRTGMTGRSARGRNYVPGIPNSVVTLNTLDTTFIDNLLAAYSPMIGAGTFVAGWQWVVVSRFVGGLKRAVGLAQPVVSVLMKTPFVRSMRSREVGHGA